MQVVEVLTVKNTKPKFRVVDSVEDRSNCSNGLKKKHGKIVYTEEQKKQIESMLGEIRMLYKTAKKRGHALNNEKVRYKELRMELLRLKAI